MGKLYRMLCSDRVSSGLDIVRHLYDGLVFAAGDAQALARCLLWAHTHPENLSKMGGRAQVYAEAYSAQHWADRWMWCFETILADG
jgi:glycosyltransferase involved in cell wall biosynthesis